MVVAKDFEFFKMSLSRLKLDLAEVFLCRVVVVCLHKMLE